MGAVVTLVLAEASPETIALLARAKELAESANVIGAAVILVHPGHRFSIDFAGDALVQDPAWARGMVAKLDDFLSQMKTPPPPPIGSTGN